MGAKLVGVSILANIKNMLIKSDCLTVPEEEETCFGKFVKLVAQSNAFNP